MKDRLAAPFIAGGVVNSDGPKKFPNREATITASLAHSPLR